MGLPDNYNRKYNPLGPKTFEAIEGLDDFIKSLEKFFFATAKLRCKQDEVENKLDLTIELHFNFGIGDCLYHFNNGDWGSLDISGTNSFNISSTLKRILTDFNQKSTYPSDIIEISLHFTNTSIIISRLYHNSIPEFIGDIIATIHQHFIYLTKGLTEMPYEIFVPVFEDTSTTNTPSSKPQKKHGYFNYWGVYFDTEEDNEASLIYSLRKKKFYKESLFLLE